MGAFNELKVNTKCNKCQHIMTIDIQFKYGETWQYIYQLKDLIKWGGRIDVGRSTYTKVKVYGVIEPSICSICKENLPEEYDIYVIENLIEGISELQSLQDYSVNINYCLLP
jgi:hypothetical protein